VFVSAVSIASNAVIIGPWKLLLVHTTTINIHKHRHPRRKTLNLSYELYLSLLVALARFSTPRQKTMNRSQEHRTDNTQNTTSTWWLQLPFLYRQIVHEPRQHT
jgi:hypothetical protein